MHFVFLAARIYPVWSVFLAIMFSQIALHYFRRKDPKSWAFVFCGVCLVAGAIVWIMMRGDLHSDQWVRSMFLE